MEKINLKGKANSRQSYYEKENLCEYLFNESRPFYHLCTPGHLSEIIFTNDDEFKFGMSLIGICADRFSDLNFYTFEWMSNHLHIILSGEEKKCYEMFDFLSSRLRRYLNLKERKVDFSPFTPSLIYINDLKTLRNEIVYVNRNGYIVNSNYTPYSSLWGAGYLFFNPLYEFLPYIPYNSLSIRDKKCICHSKDLDLSDRIMVLNGAISPHSFCKINTAELFFRDAHQYFNLLSKNYEAYSEIAKRLGDTITITDEEMFSAVREISLKRFCVSKPAMLSPSNKIEMAKIMHNDYNATNKQIQRILKIDFNSIATLFPKSK